MGSRGRPLFDLNEPPAEDNDESDGIICLQPQMTQPSTNPNSSDLFAASSAAQGILNNHAFSHASSVSGFQPFVRPKSSSCIPDVDAVSKGAEEQDTNASSKSGKEDDLKVMDSRILSSTTAQSTEREEGEWSDDEVSADVNGSHNLLQQSQVSQEQTTSGMVDGGGVASESKSGNITSESKSGNTKGPDSTIDEKSSRASVGLESNSTEQKSNIVPNSDGSIKSEASNDAQEEPSLIPKQKEVKGIEASHALRCANNPGKRKIDQRKEEMLGKKRNRQTMFLNLEDVKQAGPMKSSTPRRQNFSSPIITRTVKEVRNVAAQVERVGAAKDQKQVETSFAEGGIHADLHEPKSDSNGDNSGPLGRSRRLNSETEPPAEVNLPPIPRQGSWKQPTDSRQQKNVLGSSRKLGQTGQSSNSNDVKVGNKKHAPMKKQTPVSIQPQDTSVERLIREVTSEKFWHHPEETELQCVPGRFESVEEYVRVFEPLLFEECRAQLYSTWEESMETVSRDTHIMVRVKANESRERGWYDVKLLPPLHDFKWPFKEGDVAVLSSPRPGSVRSKQSSASLAQDDGEAEITGRVVGTVRRHKPIDTRDPTGAILHYYVGDSYDPIRVDDDHIIRKLQIGSIWYLTILGSLATTQREYVALHAFRRLNSQMQTAILQPSPEHFPKYEQQTPAMPECFTPNFVDHLRRTFNEPQLAAIQWAATHTAAEARASLEASFANEAEIVFTTVSSSGRKLFSRLSHGFDMVVIDEAAQASEVGVLPPLSLGAARCVLVGDPQQLPATVISKAAGTLMYSRSLFERFQQAGCPTMLLSVQYRMHPQIRDFPSRYFYQGRLTDSESVVKLPDEVYHKDPLLRPYIFYDIRHGRESHRGGSVSYQNIHEAQFCLRLYEHLQKTLKSLGMGKISVGIITPYKLQLKCLQREFEEVLNSEEGKDLYINTVDAFQGQERDVIIMSCSIYSNTTVDSKRLYYRRFILFPLIKGQTDTIDIAMQRVLLEEIEETCIICAKSEKIPYEYSTMVGDNFTFASYPGGVTIFNPE
ncbi:hypothetical protein AHAS_Ahas12G0034400 [Arachis hypogaea]